MEAAGPRVGAVGVGEADRFRKLRGKIDIDNWLMGSFEYC